MDVFWNCLFNIFTEYICKQIEGFVVLNICGRVMKNLRYADYIVLLAERRQDSQNRAEQVNGNCVGYRVNSTIRRWR